MPSKGAGGNFNLAPPNLVYYPFSIVRKLHAEYITDLCDNPFRLSIRFHLSLNLYFGVVENFNHAETLRHKGFMPAIRRGGRYHS